MEREEIFEKVKKIVVKQLEVKKDQVIPEAKFVDDLGAYSLDLVEMIMSIEDQFGIDIPDDDLESLVTIRDVVVYIHLYPASKRKGGREKTMDRIPINYSI